MVVVYMGIVLLPFLSNKSIQYSGLFVGFAVSIHYS